jgi:hypothetical protein
MRRRDPAKRFEQKVLDEFVLEKMRLAIDFGRLVELEADLTVSIERAMKTEPVKHEEPGELVCGMFLRGWAFLTEEILEDVKRRVISRARDEAQDDDDDDLDDDDPARAARDMS